MHRLLGQNLDAYVDAHSDAYDLAKKKWTECSLDEWKAGADGILISFAFVRAHTFHSFQQNWQASLPSYSNLYVSLYAHIRSVLTLRV